jgi:hypothetical protein
LSDNNLIKKERKQSAAMSEDKEFAEKIEDLLF